MNDTNENDKQTEVEKLFDAVKHGAGDEVDELLTQGISADSRDDKERTPLIVAAGEGNAEIAEKLIVDHGADINAMDAYGETALMAAAYAGDIGVMRLLVSKGADLAIQNKEGATALDIAREIEANDLITYLAAQPTGSEGFAETVVSTDPYDDDPVTDGSVATSAAAAMQMSPEPESFVRELDLELIPEPGRSAYFMSPGERESARADLDDKAEESPEDDMSDSVADSAGTGPETDEAKRAVHRASDEPTGKKTGSGLTPPSSVLAANEERIVYDARDNKQVRSVNEKAKKTLEKAGLELGNYTVDTVFKGSYMAVLNLRSKEFKRFRKLGKHPELMIDPKRWTEWTGGAAVKRYCLSEGIDVSSLTRSHFVELYYLRDRDLILDMAEKANTHQYTIRQLKQAIGELRDGKDDLDAGKAIIKTLDQALPLLQEPDLVALCEDKERILQELSKAERKKILTLVKKRKPGVDEWKKLMDNLEGILHELEAE